MAGIAEIVRGSEPLKLQSGLMPGSFILVGGIALYLILYVLTSVVLKRQVTTELFLIVGWAVLMLLELNALYAVGHFSRFTAVAFIIITAAAAAVSLVCYILYYKLDITLGYYDGAIPLVLAAVIPAVISAVMVIVISICTNFFVGANKFSGYRTVSDELLTISGSDPEESDIKMFSSIEEIEEYTENDFLLPEYLSAEYKISYAVYSKTTDYSTISFISEENPDEELIFRIKPLGSEANGEIQEENGEVNIITINNISYNVFQRDGSVVIEWAYGGYLYKLNGNIAEEEVEKIVYSIG